MVLRHLARDSAIYGGTDFASKLVAFLAFPLIAAALSPRAFGALELMLTATALLGMVANFGLNNALQRFYWDSETESAQRPVLVSSGLAALSLLLLAAAALGGIALLLYRHWARDWHLPVGWIGLAAGLVLMVAGQWVQYLLDVTRLLMAPWRFVGIAMVSRVMTAATGVAAVVWLGLGLDGLLVGQALVMLAAVPVALYAVRSNLTWEVSCAAARKLMHFGHPFIYAGLAFWLFGSMDRWLLASLSDVEEVGIYSVAHRFASVILFVSMAFGQAWSALAIKIRADHPSTYRSLYVDVLLALSCVMLMLGSLVALFSRESLALLMPVEYQGAALPLSALALGLVLQATMQVTAVGISLENKPHLFAKLSWLAAALNLVLNLAMIPAMGALGAAVATSLSYLFLTGSYAYHTQLLHPLPLPWRKFLILALLLIAMAACLTGIWFQNSWALSLAFRAVLMILSFLVCAALLPWRSALHVAR